MDEQNRGPGANGDGSDGESSNGDGADPTTDGDDRSSEGVVRFDEGVDGDRSTDADAETVKNRFERRETADVDGDRVRERLLGDEPAVNPEDPAEREIREVDKHSYCHQCEHFADPPDFRCTNDGTEILELTGVATVRVADCPVVLEDERIERTH